jgi:hypothetical protein
MKAVDKMIPYDRSALTPCRPAHRSEMSSNEEYVTPDTGTLAKRSAGGKSSMSVPGEITVTVGGVEAA